MKDLILNAVRLTLLLFLLGLTGCKDSQNSSNDQPIPLAANFLFAITHDNYAFEETHTSIYIESDGKVYQSIDNPAIDSVLQDKQSYLASELHQRFQYQPVLLNTIDAGLLAAQYNLLSTVDQSQLTQPVSVCADFGTIRFWGLTYNTSTNEYQTILLAERGDIARYNSSPEAVELTSWLVDAAAGTELELNNCY